MFARHRLSPRPSPERARCPECNGALEPVAREQLTARVPPYVLATAPSFRLCTGCDRVYWPGTHARRMTERMCRVVAALARTNGETYNPCRDGDSRGGADPA